MCFERIRVLELSGRYETISARAVEIDADARHGGFPGSGEDVVFGRSGSPFR